MQRDCSGNPPVTMTGAGPGGNALKGVAFVIVGVLLFGLGDSLTKYLTERYPVPFVVSFRYGINLVLLVAFLAPRHGIGLIRTNRRGLVLLRAACLCIASLFTGLALRRMPVGETVAISYLAPIGVMILSGRILGEKVSLTGWIAAALGFAGVLLIARPGSGLDSLGVLFAVFVAATSTAYHILSRLLARSETTMAMLVLTAGVGWLAFSAVLPWSWPQQMPSLFDMSVILSLGVLATLGHALLTSAYREAPASLLAPVNYTHMAWAVLFGWIIFDHMPDALSLAGIALVACSGVIVAILSQRTAPVAPDPAI
jgi:drug/metabolite transporter (DMT)-like permease